MRRAALWGVVGFMAIGWLGGCGSDEPVAPEKKTGKTAPTSARTAREEAPQPADTETSGQAVEAFFDLVRSGTVARVQDALKANPALLKARSVPSDSW